MRRPIVIGVTGGSGSGKTSVSRAILDKFTEVSILLLEQDFYYKDQSELPFEERLKTNYDHPVSYTHLRAHETVLDLVCRILLDKKKKTQ